MAHKLISKAEAKKRGLKRYFTGRKCSQGHSSERFTKGDKCCQCTLERTSAYREKLKSTTGKTRKPPKAVSKVAPALAGAGLVPINSEPINGEVISGDWRFYADRITAAWQKSVASIIETGTLLLEAKDAVDRGKFEEMIERELPFGPRAARMLMDIARNPVLSDRNRGSVLPPSWRTLYELSKFDDQVLLAKIEDHTINSEMERKDVKVIAAQSPEQSGVPK